MEEEHFQRILLTGESTSPSAVRFLCSEEVTGNNNVTPALVRLNVGVRCNDDRCGCVVDVRVWSKQKAMQGRCF